jgi:hypothetical protein
MTLAALPPGAVTFIALLEVAVAMAIGALLLGLFAVAMARA